MLTLKPRPLFLTTPPLLPTLLIPFPSQSPLQLPNPIKPSQSLQLSSPLTKSKSRSSVYLVRDNCGAALCNVQRRWLSTNSYNKFTIASPDDSSFSTPDFSPNLRPQIDQSGDGNRPFTYFVVGATGVLSAMSAKSTVLNFLSSLSASADVLALAQVEVDLRNIPLAKSVVIKWRGKPIFIRHRTDSEIEEANSVDLSTLRDPQTDTERAKKPEWIVMTGICTHLGCVPLADSGDYNGWYCPCHGSHYDISGRIRKGPAPLNLEIPKYKFIDDDHIVIG